MWIFPFTTKPLHTLSYTFQTDHKTGQLIGDIERRHRELLDHRADSRDRREEFGFTLLHMTFEGEWYISDLFATVIYPLLRVDTGSNAAGEDGSKPLR